MDNVLERSIYSIWVASAFVALAVTGVILWAVIALVTHYT